MLDTSFPSVLKSVCFGGFTPLYRRPASHRGKDMGGFVCAAHRRKNKGFPTLKRTLYLGIEKGRLLKTAAQRGLIQVICYPTSLETVDITGFFLKSSVSPFVPKFYGQKPNIGKCSASVVLLKYYVF